jgi:spore germination protein
MGIRRKLLDFKQRLSDRKMYSIVLVVIAIIAVWGLYQYKRTMDLRQELDNQYNRAFFELTGYVQNVEVLLAKSLITSTKEKTAQTMQEAWRQSNMAQSNLGQLPISAEVLANTSKFLTQVGDYAYSMNNINMSGKMLSDKEFKTIEKLHGYAVSLENRLNSLRAQLTGGRIKWGELADKGTPLFSKTSAKLSLTEFENVDKTFQKIPTLIYDGPYSDGLENKTSKGLTGPMVNLKTAKEKAISFVGKNNVKNITETASKGQSNVDTFSFNLTLKSNKNENTVLMDVTKKGGHVMWMLQNREIKNQKLSMSQAKKKAMDFLKRNGFDNMKDTYYIKNDGSAVINYAYNQNGTMVYPDLIKVKVALDDGEIIGFEAKSYWLSHTVRNIGKANISEAKATSLVNKKINITYVGTAIIPTDFNTEIFCYEIKGKIQKQEFIVYVNALTGKEENIFILMDTPNGVLTM